MRKLTNEKLSQKILNKININEISSLGGDKDKIIRKLNEAFQYHPKIFSSTNRGDYNILQELLNSYVYELKHF